MAPLKVHGNVISTATQRVFACLHEKKLDYQFINVDFSTGEHKKPHYLAHNPFGLLPAFEDGDLKLFESRAITMHIAHAYEGKGSQLLNEGRKMSIQGVWMEVEAHQFEPVTSKLNWELLFKPMFGMATDQAVVEKEEAKLVSVLDIYEKRLSESKYIGGDCFSLADLHHLPNLQSLMGTPLQKHFESRPLVKAWCDDILNRPAWKKVMELQKH